MKSLLYEESGKTREFDKLFREIRFTTCVKSRKGNGQDTYPELRVIGI